MHQALELWRQTLDDAYWQVPVRSNWRHQREASVDKALRQLVWADVAVALIGDAALPEIVEALSLRRRLIAYSRVVEETTINQTVELFNASHWEVSEAIRIGLKATQGGI
jgi:hypothetical protein